MLADPDRLKILAAVALGARSAAQAAEVAGVPQKAAVVALERLAGAGVVVHDAAGLAVDSQVFKNAARAAAERRRAAERTRDDDDLGGVSAGDAAVLRNFVERGRLKQIPAQHSKKLVVLDWLARRFEPGRVYPEEQVNLMLGMVHPDTAALRRYLVDHGFLERRDRFYWRSGGTFEID